MRPQTLITTLLPLSLSSALPSAHSTESLHSPANNNPVSIPITFSLSTLFAYLPLASALPSDTFEQKSWITFVVTDGEYSTTCSASAGPNDTLSSEYKYYDCEESGDYPDAFFAFLVGEELGRLTVKKMWDSKGTWLTGFAEQGTYWDEGDGGNVTVGPWGKMYERSAEWEFEITRVIG